MPLFYPPLPAPWMIDTVGDISGNSTLTANTVYAWSFELYAFTTPVNKIRWKMAATATGNADAGFYDNNGNLLSNVGSTANVANSDVTGTLGTALNLGPGLYYIALSPGNSTDTYGRATGLYPGAGGRVTRAVTGANASTGGTTPVLPATLGALTASNSMPIVSGLVTTGIQ
jgi:hypothetical protein